MSHAAIAAGLAFAAVVSALPPAFVLGLRLLTDEGHAVGGLDGQPALLSTSPIVWVFVALHVPAFLAWRASVLARRYEAIAYTAQSLVMFTWLQLVVWYALPSAPLPAVALLCAIFVGWALNDAQIAYDSRLVRIVHGLAYPAFLAVALAMDVSGHGLLSEVHTSPVTVANFVGAQVVLLLVTQSLIAYVGASARAQDERAERDAAHERELATMKGERRIMERLAGLLGTALSAGRFSHDVASPTSVIASSLDYLEESAGPDANADVTGALTDMRQAVARLQHMTALLARSVKSAESTSPAPVDAMVGQALSEMTENLKGHGIHGAVPVVELEPSMLEVSPGHATALANILANGVLQNPHVALRVRGKIVDESFYRIDVRDFGVPEHERAERMAVIERSLRLEHDDAPRSASYRGYGIGLMMTRVVLGRYRGWVTVLPPSSGPGVVFRVILPRRPPSSLGPEADEVRASAGPVDAFEEHASVPPNAPALEHRSV
ncbi:MAG: hypothetical protein K1X94_10185 [Sandaracinaceae bacterium]|nr:hypothetical protein [Sandaracinaceae bacterium]